jgi:hypothetical protein
MHAKLDESQGGQAFACELVENHRQRDAMPRHPWGDPPRDTHRATLYTSRARPSAEPCYFKEDPNNSYFHLKRGGTQTRNPYAYIKYQATTDVGFAIHHPRPMP